MRTNRRRRYHNRRHLVTPQDIQEHREKLQGYGQKVKPYDHSGIGYSTLPVTHVSLLPKNKAALVLVSLVFFMALILVLLSMSLESGWEYGSYDTSSYTGLDGGEHIVYTFTCDQDNSISGYLDMTTIDGKLVVDEIVDVYKCGVISAETVGNTIDEFASSLPMSQVTALKVALQVKQWQSLLELAE